MIKLKMGGTTTGGKRPTQCDAAAYRHTDGYGAAVVIDGFGPDPRVPSAAKEAAELAVSTAKTEGARAGLLAGGQPFADPTEEYPEPDMVGAVVSWTPDGKFSVAWTGDVRVYTWHQDVGELVLRTHDHTAAQRMLDDPAWKPDGFDEDEDPRVWDNIVTTSLARAVTFPETIGEAELPPADAVLLVSDGVWGAAHHDLMRGLMFMPDPQECATALVRLALEVGGRDNATAVVIRTSSIRAEEEPATESDSIPDGI